MSETAWLGLGSNIDATRHISAGLDELDRLLTLKRISSVYRSEAIGFEGDAFLNLVVEVKTRLGPGALHEALRDIEFRYGRTADATKFSSRHLDIDILSLGNLQGTIDGVELPRGEIFENAFVLAPFVELAPQLRLPGCADDLDTLWKRYQRPQQIERTSFRWRGEPLPLAAIPVAPAGTLHL